MGQRGCSFKESLFPILHDVVLTIGPVVIASNEALEVVAPRVNQSFFRVLVIIKKLHFGAAVGQHPSFGSLLLDFQSIGVIFDAILCDRGRLVA